MNEEKENQGPKDSRKIHWKDLPNFGSIASNGRRVESPAQKTHAGDVRRSMPVQSSRWDRGKEKIRSGNHKDTRCSQRAQCPVLERTNTNVECIYPKRNSPCTETSRKEPPHSRREAGTGICRLERRQGNQEKIPSSLVSPASSSGGAVDSSIPVSTTKRSAVAKQSICQHTTALKETTPQRTNSSGQVTPVADQEISQHSHRTSGPHLHQTPVSYRTNRKDPSSVGETPAPSQQQQFTPDSLNGTTRSKSGVVRRCLVLRPQSNNSKAKLDREHKFRTHLESVRQDVANLRHSNSTLKESSRAYMKSQHDAQQSISSQLQLLLQKSLRSTRQWQDRASFLLNENKYLKETIDGIVQQNSEQKAKIRELEEELSVNRHRASRLRDKLSRVEGRVKVVCRIKPSSSGSVNNFELTCSNEDGAVLDTMKIKGNQSNRVRYEDFIDQKKKAPSKDCSYRFAKIVTPTEPQSALYEEILSACGNELERGGLCVIAHGASSSGKTHSILGDPSADGSKGLLHFVLEALLKGMESLNVNVCEIYNESCIHHSLDEKSTHAAEPQWLTIDNQKQVTQCLKSIKSLRKQSATLLNRYSSRSHMVIRIRRSESVESLIEIVDLAGSEKSSFVDKAKATGRTEKQQQETGYIAKSLSSLSQVIKAVRKGDQHVTFRNSKLTRVLEPILSTPHTRIILLAHVIDQSSDMEQNLRTLQFAQTMASSL
eukprot:gb/GECG01011093.1/.p1 GENE.gb/GECG01011093.1/~~gb/GECG01011093.1/.p1  ORF type:complete len:715 (+),score=79.86 gb/GECG01011093.1/:1-2145(+)